MKRYILSIEGILVIRTDPDGTLNSLLTFGGSSPRQARPRMNKEGAAVVASM